MGTLLTLSIFYMRRAFHYQKYLVDKIRNSALGKGIHNMNRIEIYYYANIIVIGSQSSTIQEK